MSDEKQPPKPVDTDSVDYRIDILNGYRSLRGKMLPLAFSQDSDAAIQESFDGWVAEQIDSILNGGRSTASISIDGLSMETPLQFTDTQAATLRLMADRMAAAAAGRPPAKLPSRRAGVETPVTGLKSAIDTAAYVSDNNRILEEMRRLDKMDAAGPDF